MALPLPRLGGAAFLNTRTALRAESVPMPLSSNNLRQMSRACVKQLIPCRGKRYARNELLSRTLLSRSPPPSRQEDRLQRQQGGLGPVLDVKLPENVLDVLLHGFDNDIHFLGNGLVGKTGHDFPQDFGLARAKRFSIVGRNRLVGRATDDLANLSRRPGVFSRATRRMLIKSSSRVAPLSRNPAAPSFRACAISLTSSTAEKIKTVYPRSCV